MVSWRILGRNMHLVLRLKIALYCNNGALSGQTVPKCSGKLVLLHVTRIDLVYHVGMDEKTAAKACGRMRGRHGLNQWIQSQHRNLHLRSTRSRCVNHALLRKSCPACCSPTVASVPARTRASSSRKAARCTAWHHSQYLSDHPRVCSSLSAFANETSIILLEVPSCSESTTHIAETVSPCCNRSQTKKPSATPGG